MKVRCGSRRALVQTGQDQTMDDTDVVAAVLAALAERIGDERFALWFGDPVRVASSESALTVQVPSQFHQKWLRQNFRGDLEAACQEVLGRVPAIEFRVVAAPGGSRKPAGSTSDDRQRRLSFEDEAGATAEVSNSATLVMERPKRVKPLSQQIPAIPGRKYASLESFVDGTSSRVAYAAARMAAERPGCSNPLFIYGPTSVGKTHLLEGIYCESSRRHTNFHAVFLTAEQFTNSFLEALHRTGLPSFRAKLRAVNLLIVDDVQFFAGKRATMVEFVQTLDSLLRDGRQLVVSADRSPSELRELAPELTTRLAGGMVAKMEPADHATRVEIARRRAGALGLEIEPDVPDFLATHLTTHARELMGALHQLSATSRVYGRPINRALAEEALADLIHDRAKPVQFQQIEKAVCEVFGLDPESLQAGRRAKALNAPRMLAMWLARKHTRAALSEIGQYFGRRSHSTVISAQKMVGRWLAEQAALRMGDKQCNTEDAIRRVEARLKAV